MSIEGHENDSPRSKTYLAYLLTQLLLLFLIFWFMGERRGLEGRVSPMILMEHLNLHEGCMDCSRDD